MNISSLRNEIRECYSPNSPNMELSLENKMIQSGFGFFPYGTGLMLEGKESLPQKGLMIVGQDFGHVDYVTEALIAHGEADKPTYSKIEELLVNYPKDKVFLTNLFMGLRKELSMIGPNPALKAKETNYLNSTFKFFEVQINSLKPSKIIVLGKVPYNFLCERYNLKGFKVNTFEKYKAGKIPHQLLEIDNSKVLCIPHPSMWNSNVKNQTEWKEIIQNFINL